MVRVGQLIDDVKNTFGANHIAASVIADADMEVLASEGREGIVTVEEGLATLYKTNPDVAILVVKDLKEGGVAVSEKAGKYYVSHISGKITGLRYD